MIHARFFLTVMRFRRRRTAARPIASAIFLRRGYARIFNHTMCTYRTQLVVEFGVAVFSCIFLIGIAADSRRWRRRWRRGFIGANFVVHLGVQSVLQVGYIDIVLGSGTVCVLEMCTHASKIAISTFISVEWSTLT